MHRVISPKIAAVVVREWMSDMHSKLHAIIEAVAAELAPHAAKHASEMLLACIDPDPRQQLVDSILETLDRVDVCLGQLERKLPNDPDLNSPVMIVHQARNLVSEAFTYCEWRQAEGRSPAAQKVGGS